jgi:RNA polymerase sigma-70 factor (sigma-E family)
MQGDGGLERLNDVHDAALPLGALEVVAPFEAVGEHDADEVGATFGEFYRATYAEMVRLAYLLTGSIETARDLAQDSFLRVHNAWDRVEEPRAYMRRAVVNACHSHHRRRRVQERHAATHRPDVTDLRAEEMADAIAALPYRQRTAVVLRFWHDCTEAEIAAALACRPGTVGSLIHRALVELRRVIP